MPIAKRRLSLAALILLVGAGAVILAILARTVAAPARAADSNALWHVVHDLCVTDMKVSGSPSPCLTVDLARGYAVLKDIRGATQVLLIPTLRVTGIESAQLLTRGSENYFEDAWRARTFVEKRAGRPVPREDVGMAINSIYGRSQNQLHIHVDCLRRDVRDALKANEARIGSRWAAFPVELAGQQYRARRVMGAELGPNDPFKLLAEADPKARADMGRETLAVVGEAFAGGKPGFVLLSDRADIMRLDQAAGEDVLDHGCAVLADRDPDRATP